MYAPLQGEFSSGGCDCIVMFTRPEWLSFGYYLVKVLSGVQQISHFIPNAKSKSLNWIFLSTGWMIHQLRRMTRYHLNFHRSTEAYFHTWGRNDDLNIHLCNLIKSACGFSWDQNVPIAPCESEFAPNTKQKWLRFLQATVTQSVFDKALSS